MASHVWLPGWDMSHYDWDRGLTPARIRAGVSNGIKFLTHKITEGTGYRDPRFDDFWRAVEPIPNVLLGAYHVLLPGNIEAQVHNFIRRLTSVVPGWKDGPFILQIDAERWSYAHEPSLQDIKKCIAVIGEYTSVHVPIVYAPKWTYEHRLIGLKNPLWASNYGSNPATTFRNAYPGNNSSRWGSYSGQIPTLLQYGSRTVIGNQHTCDANAFRGTLSELINIVYKGETGVSKVDVIDGLDDAVPWVSSGVKAAALKAGWADKVSTRALIEYLFGNIVLNDVDGAVLAKLDALLKETKERDERILALLNDALEGKTDVKAVLLTISEILKTSAGSSS